MHLCYCSVCLSNSMGRTFFIVLVLRLILCAASSPISLSQMHKNSSTNIHCIETEKNALLNFKLGFNNSPLLSSWMAHQDCCQWSGVQCSSLTGHVIALSLRSQSPSQTLQGDQLSPALADLHHLQHLDLSLNDFRQTQLPEFLGSFTRLQHLDLSQANFRGTIPNCLANLSSLQFLDLSDNYFSLRVDSLDWLPGLSLLKVLDLGGVDLSSAGDSWLVAINQLPSLLKLSLSLCQLYNLNVSLPYVNFTLLENLDLSYNYFGTPVPPWFFNISQSLVYLNLRTNRVIGSIPQYFGTMTSLALLDLSENSLIGPIPQSFGTMTSLAVLDLSENSLIGPIPQSFGTMTSLAVLDLSENSLTGPIPITFGNLTSLTVLDLSQNRLTDGFTVLPSLKELYLAENKLSGSLEVSQAHISRLVVLDIASNSFNNTLSESQLSKFVNLRVLDFSSNSLVFNVSSHWVPPFQLETINLRSCKLGPRFPEWIQTQKDFISVDLSRASMSGTVPDWFWNLSMKVERIDLSFNSLEGNLPDLSSIFSLSLIDLSHNSFHGPLVRFTVNIISVSLANNKLSGPLLSLCDTMIANNSLVYLDLSSNLFSGPLPDCWKYGDNYLVVLNVGNNSLSGTIPYSIGSLAHLRALILRGNRFSGEVPVPLKYCTNLYFLDLGNNRLSGVIPSWIGDYTTNLVFLSLRYNEFQGNIPLQLCQLNSLIVLYLGSNTLSGKVPPCINNFLTMSLVDDFHPYSYDPFTLYNTYVQTILMKMDHPKFTMMELEFDFSKTPRFLKVIDLSDNALSGEIPREVTSLVGLRVLNLSSNHLTGSIPPDIGAMKILEALDLSRNRLSCSIPATAANLTFLSDLNLSYNDLSGEIPSGSQLEAFSTESYNGNPKLCGYPLHNKCLKNAHEDPQCSDKALEGNKKENEEPEEESDDTLYYMSSMGSGFITGFWVFWGTLAVKRAWRHAYFHFIQNIIDKVYVITAINIAKFRNQRFT